MRSVSLACALALLLAACGEEPTPTAEALLAAAEDFFQAGDEAVRAARLEAGLDGRRDGSASAVEAWREAARRYRAAYRLVDPVPENASRRAMIAFRAGRAFAKAAEHGVAAEVRDLRAEAALFWFAEAQRLAPTLRQVWYERGALHETDIGTVRDLVRAYTAYTRYLAAVDGLDPLPEAERGRVAHARARAAALAPPPDGD